MNNIKNSIYDKICPNETYIIDRFDLLNIVERYISARSLTLILMQGGKLNKLIISGYKIISLCV